MRGFFHGVGYAIWIAKEIFVAGFDAVAKAFNPATKFDPIVIYYPLRLNTDWDVFWFSTSITATPGTLSMGLRAPDALTRVNLLGPLVVVAFPILIVAKLIHSWTTTGFDLNDFIRAVLAIFAVWIVGSVASFIMGRSLYGVTVSDKTTFAEPRNR